MIGHIPRKDLNDDCNVAMSWAPEGKRRRGRLKRPGDVQRRKKGKKQVVGGGADRSNQSRGVEKLCEGPM